MEEEILKKIEMQDKKLEEIYRSVEKTRKYFLWTLIVTLVLFILPLIGLLFVIPKFLSIYAGGLDF
jgi:type II secretory pathway component PulF